MRDAPIRRCAYRACPYVGPFHLPPYMCPEHAADYIPAVIDHDDEEGGL